MSYQAQAFVGDLRGCSRGEKAVLNVLARYHDHRSKICRVSQAQIAIEAEMSERHVITLCQDLETRDVIVRERNHRGRGAVTTWQLVGMQKGEVASPLPEKKGEICAQKGEVASPPYKEIKKKQVIHTTPNPAFQAGNSIFKLRSRAHTRIARWIERESKPNPEGLSKIDGWSWINVVRGACLDLLIPFEDAIHDLPLMDEVWAARLELKKESASVGA